VMRVPLVLAGASIPRGRTVARTVALVDLAPTLADLAGTRFPEATDGVSLRASWEGKAAAVSPCFPCFLGAVAGDAAPAVRHGMGAAARTPHRPLELRGRPPAPPLRPRQGPERHHERGRRASRGGERTQAPRGAAHGRPGGRGGAGPAAARRGRRRPRASRTPGLAGLPRRSSRSQARRPPRSCGRASRVPGHGAGGRPHRAGEGEGCGGAAHPLRAEGRRQPTPPPRAGQGARRRRAPPGRPPRDRRGDRARAPGGVPAPHPGRHPARAGGRGEGESRAGRDPRRQSTLGGRRPRPGQARPGAEGLRGGPPRARGRPRRRRPRSGAARPPRYPRADAGGTGPPPPPGSSRLSPSAPTSPRRCWRPAAPPCARARWTWR
jgi:hypothetical protein